MKRVLATVLCLSLSMFALVGCGNKDNQQQQQTPQQQQQQQGDDANKGQDADKQGGDQDANAPAGANQDGDKQGEKGQDADAPTEDGDDPTLTEGDDTPNDDADKKAE